MPRSSAKVVVGDAGPLISLGRLDLLMLLPQLFAEVQVPQAVLDECLARPDQDDARHIAAAVATGSLLICGSNPLAEHADLGLGERAAIGRAMALGAGLLADDRAARRLAQQMGLAVIGTLGVLALAKRGGLLIAIAPLIERLRASGQRLGHAAVADALAAAGESTL